MKTITFKLIESPAELKEFMYRMVYAYDFTDDVIIKNGVDKMVIRFGVSYNDESGERTYSCYAACGYCDSKKLDDVYNSMVTFWGWKNRYGNGTD